MVPSIQGTICNFCNAQVACRQTNPYIFQDTKILLLSQNFHIHNNTPPFSVISPLQIYTDYFGQSLTKF